MTDNNQYICLGRSFGTHGLKGEIGLNLFNKNESILTENLKVFLKNILSNPSSPLTNDSYKLFNIEHIKFGNKVIVKFFGVNDMDEAKRLIPFELYVLRSDFPEIKDNEKLYLSDLVGALVYNESEKFLGNVKSIYSNGLQDILEIESDDDVMDIPYVDQLILKKVKEDGQYKIWVRELSYL